VSNRELTELEGAALALLQRVGPATPYALAKAFSNSPSSFWSGSAGAMYPMIERLHKSGLLTVRPTKTGQRKSKVYALTARGEDAIAEWLLDVGRTSNVGFDPLRTRLISLASFPKAKRNAYLRKIKAKMLDDAEALYANDEGDEVVKSIHRTWLKHRLAWIEDLTTDR